MIHQFQLDRGSSMGDASQQNACELMADGFIGENGEMLPAPIKGQGASEQSAHLNETEAEDDLNKMESNGLQVVSGHDNSSLLRESLQSGNEDSPLSIKAAETHIGNVDAENRVKVLENKFMSQDGNNGTISSKAAAQQELPKGGLEQDQVLVDETLPVPMNRSDKASNQAPKLSTDQERASSAVEMPLDIPASADTALAGDPLGPVQPVPLLDPCANGKSWSAPFSVPLFGEAQQAQLRSQILVLGALSKGLVPDETMMLTALAGTDASTGGNCHTFPPPSNFKASNEDVVGKDLGTTTDKPSGGISVPQAGSPISPFSSGFQKAPSQAGPELQVGMGKHLQQAQATAQEAMASATSALAQSQVVWTRMQSLKPSDLGPVLESQIASVAATVAAAASVAKAAVEAAKAISEACKEAYSQANGAHGEGFLQFSTIGGGLGQSDNAIGITHPIEGEPMQATGVDKTGKSGADGVQAEVNNTVNVLVPQKGKSSKSKNVQDNLPLNETSNKQKVQGHILPTKKPSKEAASKKRVSTKRKQVVAGEPGDDAKRLLKQKGEVAPESISVSALLEMAGAPQRPNSTELGDDNNMMNIPEAIRVGSLVEVMSEEEGLRGGWFSGKVLMLTEEAALVAYDELLMDDGSSNLEEWFPRKEPKGVTGPQRRMRPMHPISSVRETGSKKRRVTSGCQVWAVGDHVDAFIQDGWWEGVVREVKDGENKVTVYFPGEQDTVVVKPRILRPSLNWTEGKWRPCTDTPVEEDIRPVKQQKVGSLSSEDGKRISPSSHSKDEGKEVCVN